MRCLLFSSVLLGLACTGGWGTDSGSKDDGTSGTWFRDTDDPDSGAGGGASELHYFHDKAWKLAVYDERVLVTTQHGEQIWSWDPGNESVEEFSRDLGDVQGVFHWEEQLWVTHSISGVVGTVGVLTPPNEVASIAEATAEGELMRRPMEMARFGNQLAIADMGGERVWTLGLDASHVEAIETPHIPLTLASFEGALFIGSDEGVFRRGGSSWAQVDERPAYGLWATENRLLATNATHGLFVVGEQEPLLEPHMARPGSIVSIGDVVFFVDEVGGSLWSLSLAP